jgi:hypothetical protein
MLGTSLKELGEGKPISRLTISFQNLSCTDQHASIQLSGTKVDDPPVTDTHEHGDGDFDHSLGQIGFNAPLISKGETGKEEVANMSGEGKITLPVRIFRITTSLLISRSNVLMQNYAIVGSVFSWLYNILLDGNRIMRH